MADQLKMLLYAVRQHPNMQRDCVHPLCKFHALQPPWLLKMVSLSLGLTCYIRNNDLALCNDRRVMSVTQQRQTLV